MEKICLSAILSTTDLIGSDFGECDLKMYFCLTDIVFPVLDIVRLAVRNADINSDLCSGLMGDQLIGHLQRFLLSDSLTANQMLSLRILCNMLSHPEGEALALRHKDYLLSVVFDLTPPFSKQMQVNFHNQSLVGRYFRRES
jgi:hypothetical protein